MKGSRASLVGRTEFSSSTTSPCLVRELADEHPVLCVSATATTDSSRDLEKRTRHQISHPLTSLTPSTGVEALSQLALERQPRRTHHIAPRKIRAQPSKQPLALSFFVD